MGRKKLGLAVLAALALTSVAMAEEVEREGVIVSHSGNNLEVRTREGSVTVVVTPETTIRERQNVFNRERREANTLIPGLIITVEGDLQGNTLTAERIQFTERDWRSAIATRAGTAEQFAELRRAIIEGQEYDIRAETTVYFASGSAVVAPQYREALRGLAEQAPSFGNYRISILGYADSRGNPEANERLSLRRSMAVSNLLRQTGLIQPGRVLSPTAMGEGNLAPGDTPPANDAEARRVVVRVITPRGQLTE